MDTINIEDELKFVDPQKIELKLNAFGDLELHLSDGTVHTPVVPARSFPLTDVTHYIAIETDRGRIVFDLSTRSAISQFDDGRLLVKDVDGNRYEIPNYLQLDLKSIALIETQV